MEPGNQTMISPLTRHSFLLSSRTVFMLLSQYRAHCILKYHESRNLTSTTLALQFSCTIKSNILIKSLRIVDCMKSTKHLPSAKDFYFRDTRSIEHPPAHQTWPQMVKSKAVKSSCYRRKCQNISRVNGILSFAPNDDQVVQHPL